MTLADGLRALVHRVGAILEECEPAFPMYVGDDGAWYTTGDGNWCAGHWIGLLWLAARHAETKADRHRFAVAAHGCVERFREQALDSIFAGMNHYYAGYLGYDVVGNETLRELGRRGADAMVELFDPVAEQIPVGRYRVLPDDTAGAARHTTADWDALDLRHVAAVDAIHTSVPVLWRAAAESGDARYADLALRHAKRHVEWFVRDDGSTTQLRPYDAETGAPGRAFSPLAETDDGCWSRGLGWNVAGLAAAYAASEDPIVGDALRRSATFYERSSDRHLVPAWDCFASGPRDASAAAVAAYGLVPVDRALGTRILEGLVESCVADNGAVLHGCYRYPQRVAVDAEVIWADFYTLAALDRALSTGR